MQDEHQETCPFCRTQIAPHASVCTGCGARKTIRGFPNGGSGFATFSFLWLGPTALILFTAFRRYFGQPDLYSGEHVMSGPVFLGLLLLGGGFFYTGLRWIRKLMARSSDILWVR